VKDRRTSLAMALIVFALTLLVVAQPATALVTQGWVIVNGPTGPGDALNAVVAISSSNVWAVGNDMQVEHWNGAAWSVVHVPAPAGTVTSALTAVDASGANNVWALGWWENDVGPQRTLAEHWNGAKWSIVSSRTPDKDGDQFNGVAVFGAKSVWGIGSSIDGSALAEHWNGTSWKSVAIPDANPDNQNILDAVAGASSRNVWAVGNWTNTVGVIKTLIEHWNGTAWKIVAAPSPSRVVNSLGGVTAIAPDDVWAVGYDGIGDSELDGGLALHWNGSKWTQVAMPTQAGSGVPRFSSVAASSATSVWAVATDVGDQDAIEHWDGAAWSAWPAPNPSFPVYDVLNGVTTLSNGDAWAVGASSPTDIFTPTTFRLESGVVGTSSLAFDSLNEIEVGQSVQVSGTLLFSQGANPAGSTVDLVRTDPDGSSTPIGSVTVDFFGQFSLTDTPTAAGTVTYSASFEGDAFHQGSSATGDLVVDPAP